MSNFAWIGYYAEKEFFLKIAQRFGLIKKAIGEEEIEKRVLESKPLEVIYLEKVCSNNGSQAKGSIILAPLLLKQIAYLDKKIVLEKILSSVEIALKRKTKVICLPGALAEFLPLVKEKVKQKIFFVTGRKFLVATVIDNILKASQIVGSLDKIKLSIFDITSAVSRISAQILANYVREIWIFDMKKRNKNNFPELENISSKKIKITNSISDVLKKSKLVINTSLLISQEAIDTFEPGSIIFDAIVPFWVAKSIAKKRKDVFPVEAAWTSRGPLVQNTFDIVFPKDAIYCCIAEATMLGLEENIRGSFLKVTPLNITRMREIGERHGFFLPKFRYEGRVYEEEILRKDSFKG